MRLLYEATHESIADMNPWLPWCHPSYALEESEKWVATRLCAQFGFEELKLKRLETVITVGNARSQRVAERTGATTAQYRRSMARRGDVLADTR